MVGGDEGALSAEVKEIADRAFGVVGTLVRQGADDAVISKALECFKKLEELKRHV